MSDEQINELKNEERLKIDIPVEEESSGGPKGSRPDLAEEFKRLGRQFADTLESVINSEEVRRVEGEVRAGMKSFADEVEKAFREAKDSPTATRMKEEAGNVAGRVESTDVSRKAQEGLVSGLRWLSTELEKMASQLTPTERAAETPAEKSPPAE